MSVKLRAPKDSDAALGIEPEVATDGAIFVAEVSGLASDKGAVAAGYVIIGADDGSDKHTITRKQQQVVYLL